jgi:outer membrane protein TolC
MGKAHTFWRRGRARLVGALAVPALFTLTAPARADETPPKAPVAAPAAIPAAIPAAPLDLAACRALALERQPAIAANRASLNAAQLKARALEDLRLAGLVEHDIPIRRQQACIGVQIAQARLSQSEQETLYAVTRTYLSYLYARQQQELLEKALGNLKDLKETVKQIVEDGLRKDVTSRDLDRINVYYLLAEGRMEEATNGGQRARAALKEAMGLGPQAVLELPSKAMPYPQMKVAREPVLDLALTRRAELIQATLAEEVFALEIKAQAATHSASAKTFASASDLHATPVPQGSQNNEYRPGAIAPEMPTILPGNKEARVQQAAAYDERARAVVEKTRNLIGLEAEDAFLRWQEAARKTARLREAADNAEKLARNLRDDFKMQGTKVRLDDVINGGILAAQLRVQANEALRDLVLGLAALERVTAGGILADFGAP